MQLSPESLAKNQQEHPGLAVSDYLRLPALIPGAQLIIQDGDQTLVFVRANGKIYHAVVKASGSGKALFLTPFRYTSAADIERMKRRGKVLKGEL